MPAALLALLFKPSTWAWLAVGAMALTIGVQQLVIRHDGSVIKDLRGQLVDPATKETWQSEAVAAAANLSACKISLANETAALDAQSAAVAALKAEGDAATAAANRAAQAALAGQRSAQARAAAILATKTTGGDCAGLAQLRSSLGQ